MVFSNRKPQGTPNTLREFLNPLMETFQSEDLRRALPILVLVACLYNVLGLALPMVILQIMDRVVVNQSMETLTLLVIGVTLSLVFEEILRLVNGSITSWLGARFEHKQSVRLLQRFLHVPLGRLQQEEYGQHIERIMATAKVAEFYSGQALLVLLDIPFMLLFLAVIFIIGGWVALVPVVLLIIFVFLVAKLGLWLHEQVENGRAALERRRNFLFEVLSGIYTVKTMAMEPQMERRHERLQAGNAEVSQSMAYGSSMVYALGMSMSHLMIVSVIFAGGLSVLWGQMTPGGVSACMLLSIRTLQPLRRGISIWTRYQAFLTARKSLQEVDDMPLIDDQDKPELPRVGQGLELCHVGLKRLDDTPLFDDLSLQVNAGECIVIQGQSGSGKSSLLGLINGIYLPDAGKALVDGRNLNEFSSDSVQRQIALLPQSGSLVTGTILENMTMFDDRLNQAALDIAAQLGLDRAVANMKLGYETPVGEGNTGVVPAGLRQTVSVVRELVNKPSVILFDEANSSLDMRGDKLLLEYLKQQKGLVTMILITHRPSWQKIADRTFTLSNGRLVAGMAAELAKPEQNKATMASYEHPLQAVSLAQVIDQHFDQATDFSICLPVLLQAIGWQGNSRELMVSMPHVQPNLDISGLCNTLANLGWQANSFSTDSQSLDHRLLPCLFVSSNAAAKVILGRQEDGRLRCFDAATASEMPLEPDQQRAQVYVFKKSEEDSSLTRRDISFFNKLLVRFKKLIGLAFVLTLLNTVFALAPPLFLRAIYDKVLPTGDWQMLIFLLIGVLIVLGLDFYIRSLRSRIVAYIGGRADYILGTRVFRQIINLPISATANISVRRQVERMRNFEGLRDFFLGPLATIALDLPANIIILIAIGIINPWALIVILIAVILYWLLAVLSQGFSARTIAASSRAASARIEFINETFYQMNTIRSSGRREHWLGRFRDLSAKAVLSKFDDNQVHARVGGIGQIIASLTGFSVLIVCALGVLHNQISVGAMIASMILVWRLVGPMQNVFLSIASLRRIRNSVMQIENLMRLPTEADVGVHQTIRPAIQGALSFSRVSFRYLSDADPVLLGISFALQPGQFAVIAGSNAAGKSTLLKLISRIYLPQAGTIRLDGVDIRQLTVTDLRTRISYLPQTNDVFYGTIAQNLRLAHPEATDEELVWAVKMVGLLADIDAMTDGFNTRISESRVNQLPQGFLVRLALARAIIKPSPITLLDQPGDILDDAGEEALLRCISYLRGRSTTLLISHRPSHMRLADTVIYMERGAIAAMGSYDAIQERFNRGAQKS